MKIVFRNMQQIEKFCNIASRYNNVVVSSGSVSVDGESIIGVSAMGLNRVLDVTFNDKDKIVQFESEVTALGITR